MTLLPWSALGWPSDVPTPRRFALSIATDEDVSWFAGGAVRIGATMDDDDEPEPGGVFDEEIFGEMETPKWRSYFDRHPYDRPQSRRFGRIDLPEPITDPWTARFGGEPITRRVLPVLPAGLRPIIFDGERTKTSDLTLLTLGVANRAARLRRLLELNAPEIILENERRMMQLSVEALFLDGKPVLANDESEREIGRLMSILMYLNGPKNEAWRHAVWIEQTMPKEPRLLSVIRWPTGAYVWRAALAAACIELVPTHEDGSVDDEALFRLRDDKFVHLYDNVTEDLFGEALGVYHNDAVRDPHVDVHSHRMDGDDRVLLVTGGMSARAMADGSRAELACWVPSDLDEQTRLQIMRSLCLVSRVPFRKNTTFAARHTIEVDESLAKGSSLYGFVLRECDEPWAETLHRRLPRSPKLFTAIGLTRTELAHARANGSSSLIGAAREKLRDVTNPARTTDVV